MSCTKNIVECLVSAFIVWYGVITTKVLFYYFYTSMLTFDVDYIEFKHTYICSLI